MKIIKIPKWFQFLFPSLHWRFKTNEKVIYLTFDDGPTKELTNWIVDELNKVNAKATFFCLGKNIAEHPKEFDYITNNEHQIGNHSYNHLSGWNTSTEKYSEDVENCQSLINTNLFRPPYGRITLAQINKLKRKYKIIMWDINSWDFDQTKSPLSTFNNLTKKIDKGSIVLLHDNLKSEENLKILLPKILSYYSQKGYVFRAID
ncbi:MAG: polysaccharide deacetylase family protein [Flavobacteriales bacterium]|jgi:peptidoglycan/xylan/chitin deacetylase (PgdA/CDA1 family)